MGRIELTRMGGNADTAKRALTAQTGAWLRDCDRGDARACVYAGVISAAIGNRPGGKLTAQRGCSRNDALGCLVVTKLE